MIDTTVHRQPGEVIAVILPVTHCLIWGCKQPIRESGYCAGHYAEYHENRRARGFLPRPPCSMPGCGRPNHARGMCKDHYNEAYNEARRARRRAACTS